MEFFGLAFEKVRGMAAALVWNSVGLIIDEPQWWGHVPEEKILSGSRMLDENPTWFAIIATCSIPSSYFGGDDSEAYSVDLAVVSCLHLSNSRVLAVCIGLQLSLFITLPF